MVSDMFCLPIQTSIRVKRNGIVKKEIMRDLEVGDIVFTAKGTSILQETIVKNVHRRKVKRDEMLVVAYKVGKNKAYQYATKDHPYAVSTSKGAVYKTLKDIKVGDHLYAYNSQELEHGYDGKSVRKLKREVIFVGKVFEEDWHILTSTQNAVGQDEIEVVSPECYPHNSFIAGSGHMQMHGADWRLKHGY